jgi:flagellar motor switch protein FliN/FliY
MHCLRQQGRMRRRCQRGHVSEPVDLVVGDRIVARGEVVVVNGNFALRITEVATPQLRLESIRCLF